MTGHRFRLAFFGVAALAAAFAMPGAAFAQTILPGQILETWMDGFWAGLGQPIFGAEHLLGLLLAAIVAARSPRPGLVVTFFALGSLVGVLSIAPREPIGFAQVLVLLSLPALGAIAYFVRGGKGLLAAWLLFFVGAVHGLAYAGGIAGANAGPLVGYLFGLIAVQTAFGIVAARYAQRTLAGYGIPSARD